MTNQTQRKCFICLNVGGLIDLTLKPSRDSLEKVRDYASKRASFGETNFSPLCERIASLTEEEYSESIYHCACYKNIVNNEKLKRAEKRFLEASSSSKSVVPPKKGRPSTSHSLACSTEVTRDRQKRSTGVAHIKRCVFQCSNPSSGELHRAESEAMGSRFMFIKSKTQSEKVRIALAHVNQPSDCAAFDLMYHRDCLRDHERKIQQAISNCDKHSDSKLGRYVADVDILNAIKCSLTSGCVITMNDINEAYVCLLTENDVDPGSSHHKKHLKSIIRENIEDATFVKSHRAYESEQVLSETILGVTVSDLREQTDEDDVKCIENAAAILRKELATNEQWKFTGSGSLMNFHAPPKLVTFLRWLLIGTKNRDVKGKRDEDSKKSVNLVSQQMLHNFRTDRQTSYQPVSDAGFRIRTETPLSVGLALTVHKKTRSKGLVNVLSQLQIGATYANVVNIEKRIACGVAERMKTTGGFCLPSFVMKGKSVSFAADNIDFLENTADGQNTLHGTMLVINQNQDNEADVPVNAPLRIPEEIVPVDIETNFINPSSVQAKPITFEKLAFHSHDTILRKYETYDRAWFMASFAHRDRSSGSNNPEEQCRVPDDSEQHTVQPSGKILKEDIMPTWAATNSLLMQSHQQHDQPKTQSGIVAPLLRRSPTDYSALYTVLCLAQGISAFVVGPERRTVITLDLDLYERATKLQSSTGNANWLLRVGELHACFASLHATGKYLEGSGLDSISIEAGLYSPTTIRQIFTGKWFKRGVEYHITNIMACYELLFEALSQQEHLDTMVLKCHELRSKLHQRQDDITDIFEEVCSILNDQFHTTLDQDLGEMAQFLRSYMKQVECLLHLIRASRQGEWELHLGALEEQVKYYFAHDLYKYARLVPVYLAQMQLLKTTDQDTWEALKCGDFMVTKSGIPFSSLFVDQTLEQLIRELKVAGGITGITQNKDALSRFFLIAPELIGLIQEFQDGYCTDGERSTTKEHYQLNGSMPVRMFNNSAIIKEGIIRHCGGNPFLCKSTKLMNIASSMLVPETAKEDILLRDDKGAKKFKEFVSERLVASTAEKSVWDPIKKMKLKTFSTCQKKTSCKIGSKLVKLREDRQLLARFLVVQQSRPSMIQSLSETLGKHEFSVIPRSLFSSDGLLLIPTDKSAFVHAIEDYKMEPSIESEEDLVTTDASNREEGRYNVCIIDAMAIVQAIKKGPQMVNCSDFAQAFVRIICNMASGYNEVRVIFDRYIDNSLKAQTRGKRCAGVEPVKFDINDSTNIRLVPLKTLLSHIETKEQLTEYLGKALLHEYSDSRKSLVVVYGTATHSNKPNVFDPNITEHSHEEADTLIPMHVLDASKTDGDIRDIDVYSPDTDVFILLMDLFSTNNIPGELHFITGKGKAKRTIDIRAQCLAIGSERSKGLLGLHAFTGADWGGKFAGVSKKKWIKHYLSLDSSCDVVDAFRQFGDDGFDVDNVSNLLEGFVCRLYAKNSKCSTVTELRWELFKSKNLEAEKLPPTLGALKPHIQRANLMSIIGKGYKQPRPQIPSLIDNGWEKTSDGTISPKKCLELPAPQAVLELVKCGCREKCTSKCSCRKNNLPCTALCKCNDCDNTVDYDCTSDDDSV